MVRLRAPHTQADGQWAKTFKALHENRGACDEVWFSTGIGFPKMDWHEAHVKRLAKYAGQLRAVGIIPSLQFQATLGHSDGVTVQEGADGKTWGGFIGRGGKECKYCNCPRQVEFIAYVREMARLYASFKPGSVWIDDDLRGLSLVRLYAADIQQRHVRPAAVRALHAYERGDVHRADGRTYLPRPRPVQHERVAAASARERNRAFPHHQQLHHLVEHHQYFAEELRERLPVEQLLHPDDDRHEILLIVMCNLLGVLV